MKHFIPSEFRKRPVMVDLVGCGGTGAQLLTKLARLHVAILSLGHSGGLYVECHDPDIVTEANVGRTLFGASDIGQSKAAVLTTRINLVYGLQWRSWCREYNPNTWHMQRAGAAPDIVITATDSLKSRAEIYRGMLMGPRQPARYWLDLGNDSDTGQVVLGEPDWILEDWERETPRKRLPHVVDLFPDMLERAETEPDEPESCTLMAALDRQALFVNDHVATWGAELLWRLFRDGGLDYHGAYINALTGQVNPIPVEQPDPEVMARRLAIMQAAVTAPEGELVPV